MLLIQDSNVGKSSNEIQFVCASSKDLSSVTDHLSASESIPPSLLAEGQRCMALYFALCTKVQTCFPFEIYIYK